jgi:hypothetical protein
MQKIKYWLGNNILSLAYAACFVVYWIVAIFYSATLDYFFPEDYIYRSIVGLVISSIVAIVLILQFFNVIKYSSYVTMWPRDKKSLKIFGIITHILFFAIFGFGIYSFVINDYSTAFYFFDLIVTFTIMYTIIKYYQRKKTKLQHKADDILDSIEKPIFDKVENYIKRHGIQFIDESIIGESVIKKKLVYDKKNRPYIEELLKNLAFNSMHTILLNKIISELEFDNNNSVFINKKKIKNPSELGLYIYNKIDEINQRSSKKPSTLDELLGD